MKWKGRLIWEAKIGIDEIGELELGADFPMRQILYAGFVSLTGREPDFCFSGWNAELTESQQAVIYKKGEPS